MYTTPAFITEAFHLVSYTSTAAFNHCYSELMVCRVLANSYWVSSTMLINAKATHINDTDYISHITAVELV